MKHEALPIFISYASYDNTSDNQEDRWLDRLLQFLEPLALDGLICSWNDTELTVGNNWRTEIRTAIENAKVAILLVSPAFLASEFIRTEELPKLLQKANSSSPPDNTNDDMAEGMLILPILLRPCLIEKIKFEIKADVSEVVYASLNDFQYVPKRMAMNGLSQYEQDLQFKKIAGKIYEALELNQAITSIEPKAEERFELENLLISFLCHYHQYWFNALRISNWGGKQENYKGLNHYSVQEVKYTLEMLASPTQAKIKTKQGKKSTVFKCLD